MTTEIITSNTLAATRIRTVAFRNISIPDELKPFPENTGKLYIAVVEIKDLPRIFEEWREVNPRDPNTNSSVSRDIRKTLEEQPDNFIFRNRGLTIIADSVSFDNEKSILTITFSDKSIHGLLDGGHSFAVIQEYLNELDEPNTAFVKLEIIVGLNDSEEITEVVASRNTSLQVKEESLQNLNDLYDPIKSILANEFYANCIAYKENELNEDSSKKPISVRDILSYLICFDKQKYTGIRNSTSGTQTRKPSHPIKAYSGKASVVKDYGKEEERNRLIPLLPLLPDILRLRDQIELALPKAYKGSFGKIKGITSSSAKSSAKHSLSFTEDKESEYRIPESFIYPILAAFRYLVIIGDDHKAKWLYDPFNLFEEIQEELVARVCEIALKYRDPNKLGKDEEAWRACFDHVKIVALEKRVI